MPNTLSPNMSLILPTVGSEPAPTWAEDLNSNFSLLDQHDHAHGAGVPITPSGLNINENLSMALNNLIDVRSVRFNSNASPISGPLDLQCIYVSGVDLYYNDGNGNQVRMTQSGSIAGTSGSIANLTSPASATYVSFDQTFVWQSDASTPANMDMGGIILRNIVASSNGITITPPNALASNYSLTLPTALPGSSSLLLLSSAGVMSTLAVSGNANKVVRVNSGASAYELSTIDTSNITDGAVTKPKLAALGQQISSSISFTTSSTSYVDVTGLTVTITTTGRPVMLMCMSGGTGTFRGQIQCTSASNPLVTFNAKLVRDSTDVAEYSNITQFLSTSTGATKINTMPATVVSFIDTPGAGTYVYKIQTCSPDSTTVAWGEVKLVAYEL